MEISTSVGGIIEREGKILLTKTENKYGILAGKADNTMEAIYPRQVLVYELLEEAYIYPEIIKLFGIIAIVRTSKISIGYIFKVPAWRFIAGMDIESVNSTLRTLQTLPPAIREESEEVKFFDRAQVSDLLTQDQIRVPKFNIPVLNAWLANKTFLFQIKAAR